MLTNQKRTILQWKYLLVPLETKFWECDFKLGSNHDFLLIYLLICKFKPEILQFGHFKAGRFFLLLFLYEREWKWSY